MDVEFFVHGVPNGEDFWGNENERQFFGTFYDESTDKQKFLIQARQRYFYYSYLVYDSVVAYDGRAGSYFGMTLRFDAYCRDFMSIYRILDVAYNSYVLGKLLVTDKAKLKYTAPSFAGFNVKGIEQKVFALLNDALRGKRFENIAGILSTGQVCKLNLYDCTEESIMADIRQYGKIALSPYYPKREESSMQQQCDSKIKAIQQQCNAQINEIKSTYEEKERTANATIGSLRNQVAQLSTTVQQKESKIDELQQKVNELQNKLARERQNKDIDELIEQIKEPVKSLADILDSRNVVNPQKKKESGKRQPRKPYYIIGIIILVVVIVLTFFKFCGKKKDVAEYEPARMEQAGEYRNEGYAAEGETNEKKAEEENVQESPTVENPFSEEGTFDIGKVKIDIKHFNGGNLKIGTTYEVRAVNGSEQGSWDVDGGEIVKKDAENLTMKPTSASVTIRYIVNGAEKPRTLTATE